MDTPEIVEIDAVDQATAALGTHLRSTTSALCALDGCNEEESALQLKVVIPAQHSPHRRSRGKMVVSADEARLLGESPKHDPSAIAIAKPSANQGNTHKRSQPIPRGFQPKNTLGQSSNAHQAPNNGHSSGFPSTSGRKRNQLEIGVSIGDNVKQISPEFGLYVPLVGEPLPKRKKLGSSYPTKYLNPPSSHRSDILRIGQPPKIFHEPEDHACENHSQSLTLDRLTEYAKPQKTMGNSKTKAKIKAKDQKTENSESVTLHSPDASPTLVPVEIQLHNATPPPISRPAYKGTARTNPSTTLNSGSAARETAQAGSGGKSKYFPVDRRTETESRMNQYRDYNGRRRRSDMRNLSSDELESGTTVGNHAVVNLASSDKRTRSTIPTEDLVPTLNAFRDNFGGLAPSTIPSTKFGIRPNKRQQPKNPPPTSVDLRQEESKSWGIELGSIAGTDATLIKGPDLGLDFNSMHQVYQVQLQGKKQGVHHQINPKSILKVLVAEGGTKLRFEFPSGGKIDIKMLTESDVYALLKHMRDHRRVKIEWKSSEWMDKAFDLRENSGSPKNSRRACHDELQDVQSATVTKHRREDAQRTLTLHDEHNPKRQRRRLLDGMHEEDYTNAHVQVGPEQIKSKDQIDDIVAANSNFLDQVSFSASRFSQRIHNRTPNPHLTGSRAELQRYARQAKQLPTREENLQKFIRRKPTHLGTPWKKPLLFPKDGKKKASVEFSDLERLEEAEFLNDNLIGFYLRYLEQRLEETRPEIAKKVYFFNTYFFASLTNTQKGKRDINYEAVQNWTRSVDIFAFEYVVVPINESAHWYLAIICNLPAILPDLAVDNSSAEIKNICSLNSNQHIDNKSLGAAILSDRLSSPIGEVAYMEPAHSTAIKSEGEPDIEDHAPTASFAEMSLDTKPYGESSVIDSYASNPKPNPKSRAQEQGLLDAQINDDLAQVTAETFERVPSKTEDAEQTQNEEGAVLPLDQKVHVSAKKRKRKSFAPITRINPDSPAIITFDSLGLTHSPTIRTLKNYLHEEGRAKRGLEWDDASIKGVTAKDIPEQNNLCDCGLFLLGYVDKFLDNPKEFTSKILARQYDVSKDWPRLNPSTLRVSIRKQIIDLHEEQQRDRRENARKSDKDHGKEEPLAGKKGNPKERVEAEKGREESQSPDQTPPSLRNSPKLEIDSKRDMGKEDASETALGKDVLVRTKPGEIQSSCSILQSRLRSLKARINSKKGLTREEALKDATEIGAPEPRMFIDSFEGECREDSSISDDNADNHLQNPEIGYDVDKETSHAAANHGYSENERTGQFDDFHRFSPSPSVDSTEVVDHAQAAVDMPSVIQDSQPDASQENLGKEPYTSVAPAAVRGVGENMERGSHRSPLTASEAEKPVPVEGRLVRPSNTRVQEEKSIIEIDD